MKSRIEQSIHKEVKLKKEVTPATDEGCKDDVCISQKFTCCGHENYCYLWEGWDCVENNTIPNETVDEFNFCPYCGKKFIKKGVVCDEHNN